MEKSAATIDPLPRDGLTIRASWPAWELEVHDLLDRATTDDNGIMGFAMSPERYALLTGDENAVHVPIPEPAPLPDNPTANQTAAHKYRRDNRDTQQHAVKTAKNAIIHSLGPEARGLITETTHGTRRRSLLQIMDILRAHYGTLSPADLAHQKTLLLEPFKPATPIRDHLRKHREVHQVCAAAAQALTEADTVAALRHSVKHVPTMAAAVQHFVTLHPTMAAQTFEILAQLLGEAEDNADPEPTTGTAGYSAAAVSMDNMTQMIAAAVTQALKDQRERTKPPIKCYCWTHGPGAHSSQDCKQPAEGHVRSANGDNRQGGASCNPRYKKM